MMKVLAEESVKLHKRACVRACVVSRENIFLTVGRTSSSFSSFGVSMSQRTAAKIKSNEYLTSFCFYLISFCLEAWMALKFG